MVTKGVIILEMGNRIKKQRLRLQLTQKELSEKLGLTPKMISFYENNHRVPPADMIRKLSEIFNITSDYLLGIGDDETTGVNSFRITVNKTEKELLDKFRNLDKDYKNIILGEVLKCGKLQEHEYSLSSKTSSEKKHA